MVVNGIYDERRTFELAQRTILLRYAKFVFVIFRGLSFLKCYESQMTLQNVLPCLVILLQDTPRCQIVENACIKFDNARDHGHARY